MTAITTRATIAGPNNRYIESSFSLVNLQMKMELHKPLGQ
jgi:hypothetical protein